MVHQHHHRASLLRKQSDVEEAGELRGRLADYACNCQHRKHGHDALLRMLAGFALASCLLLLLLLPVDELLNQLVEQRHEASTAPTVAMAASNKAASDDGSILCDRSSSNRTDVCVMRGDVRTQAASNSLLLVLANNNSGLLGGEEERIRPYTRKWETSVMSTIDELRLRSVPHQQHQKECDVRHDVPAVVFSTGGYTGNVYHEFNDGIIPLYITARHFDRKVVLVALEYHDWWVTKYGHILRQLSDYPLVDFTGDRRTHCFPEAVVGLRIHDELAIDPARTPGNRSIGDFRLMLDDAFRDRVQSITQEEEEDGNNDKEVVTMTKDHKPCLVIVSRNGSRAIENEAELARAAAAAGFRVSILRPRRDTELARMYRVLNASDVMVGVHGAAMTHFLFMRPGSVFIQIVPLGTDWAAETYYGGPARRLGLRYMPYKIAPSESSLTDHYAMDHPVLTHPDTVNAQGWQRTKKVYLDGQNVRLDIPRFRRRLQQAYTHFQQRHY